MFGMGRRTSLIKTLVEARLTLRGVDAAEARDVIKSLGTITMMGLPEAIIVTVLEAVKSAQSQSGLPLSSGPPDLLARRLQGSSVHAATSP